MGVFLSGFLIENTLNAYLQGLFYPRASAHACLQEVRLQLSTLLPKNRSETNERRIQ